MLRIILLFLLKLLMSVHVGQAQQLFYFSPAETDFFDGIRTNQTSSKILTNNSAGIDTHSFFAISGGSPQHPGSSVLELHLPNLYTRETAASDSLRDHFVLIVLFDQPDVLRFPSAEKKNALEENITRLSERGFLSAKLIDCNQADDGHAGLLSRLNAISHPSGRQNSDQTVNCIDPGPVYQLGTIYLQSDGENRPHPVNRMYNAEIVRDFAGSKLRDYFNSGYPFAGITIRSIQIDSTRNTVDIYLESDVRQLVTIDDLFFAGNRSLSVEYLRRQARFEYGLRFSESLASRYRRSLIRSPFITESEPAVIVQSANQTWGLLFQVTEQRSSQIDLMVGYNPMPGNTYNLVGSGDLYLNNLIAEGSSARISFHRFPGTVSRLHAMYEQHWIGGMPLMALSELKFFIQDSTYFSRSLKLRTDWEWADYLRTGVIAEYLLTDSDENIANRRVIDSEFRSAGFVAEYNSTDRFFSQTSGWHVRLSTSRGVKQLRNIPDLSNLSRRYQINSAELLAQTWISLHPRWILSPRMNASAKFSDVHFLDDLYRFGGTNSLRGYREEQFLANAYAWTDLEQRYLLDKDSYAFIFGAAGIYRTPQIPGDPDSAFVTGRLYSFGFGFSYRTPLGLLRFSYAVSEEDVVSNGKVHFGITNRF